MTVLVASRNPKSLWTQSFVLQLRTKDIWAQICDPNELGSVDDAVREIQSHGTTHLVAVIDHDLSEEFLSATKDSKRPMVVLPSPESKEAAEYYSKVALSLIANQRMGNEGHEESVIEHSGIRLDLAANSVTYHGKDIHLPPQEYLILRHMMLNAGLLCTRGELNQVLYENIDDAAIGNRINTCISMLNEKLHGRNPDDYLITTMHGRGYLFDAENSRFSYHTVNAFNFMSDGTVELYGQTLMHKQSQHKECAPISQQLHCLLRALCDSYNPHDPEHYISKETIMLKTDIKSQASLKVQIQTLRKSIEKAQIDAGIDNEATHKFIQTVWDKGLRFVAAPENHFTPAPSSSPDAEPPPESAPS